MRLTNFATSCFALLSVTSASPMFGRVNPNEKVDDHISTVFFKPDTDDFIVISASRAVEAHGRSLGLLDKIRENQGREKGFRAFLSNAAIQDIIAAIKEDVPMAIVDYRGYFKGDFCPDVVVKAGHCPSS